MLGAADARLGWRVVSERVPEGLVGGPGLHEGSPVVPVFGGLVEDDCFLAGEGGEEGAAGDVRGGSDLLDGFVHVQRLWHNFRDAATLRNCWASSGCG